METKPPSLVKQKKSLVQAAKDLVSTPESATTQSYDPG